MSQRVIVFANGVLAAAERVRALIREGDVLVAADGGAHHVLSLGLRPHVVIGDFDSLLAEVLESLTAAGVNLQRYPREKDETDLELALRHALTYQPRTILVVAALGQRLDQTLGNLGLLAAPWLDGVEVRLDDGLEEVFLVRKEALIHGQPGETVSLIPWGGPAEGVVTEGLRWPLREETLYPEQTRGISNELLQSQARLVLKHGALLVIHRRSLV